MPESYIELETTEESFRKLSPATKADMLIGYIKKHIREHPDGIVAPIIARDLKLSQTTVNKHLDYLVATRQIYKKEYSPRNVIYFPNGRLSHPYFEMNIDVPGQRFRISLIENQRGKFLYLQEIQNTPSSGENVTGGIIIKKENAEILANGIFKLLDRESEKEWRKNQRKINKK